MDFYSCNIYVKQTEKLSGGCYSVSAHLALLLGTELALAVGMEVDLLAGAGAWLGACLLGEAVPGGGGGAMSGGAPAAPGLTWPELFTRSR